MKNKVQKAKKEKKCWPSLALQRIYKSKTKDRIQQARENWDEIISSEWAGLEP